MTRAARDSRAELVPVDSEHSAIWQSALAGDAKEIRRVILTASGGPFRNFSAEQLAQVTVAEALDHPNWEMGQKITIDSATMINKALEMIEAKWLFGLRPDQIEVMIHPQSIVHSLVEFVDGSVIAQLSPPDMKLPIQYALTYPHRVSGIAERIDWSSAWRLEFFPPNSVQQAALDLGRCVCENTGTCGAVLNAANEIAVAAFLAERISFNEIVPRCREILEQHKTITSPTYEQLIAADEWARQEMNKWIFA
jgi:1-deoxy-D-xylulose-5-phosphate reductoisomerase